MVPEKEDYDAIFFDLDGVIFDSSVDGYEWADKARKKKAEELGFCLNDDEAEILVGSQENRLISELLEKTGMNWGHLAEIEKAKENKKKQLIQEGKISLNKKAQKILDSIKIDKAAVTNAPLEGSLYGLKLFEIDHHFTKVCAPEIDKMKRFYCVRKPKPTLVNRAIQELDVSKPVMVGDSKSDVIAANRADIDSIFLGSKEITKADYSIKNLNELIEVV
jgi:HAD superfamily hydrolase (TIGR01549 family)